LAGYWRDIRGPVIDVTSREDYNIFMTQAFIKWVMNTIAIILAVKFVPGIVYSGEWWGILIVGMIFGLVNTVIRPLISSLPSRS